MTGTIHTLRQISQPPTNSDWRDFIRDCAMNQPIELYRAEQIQAAKVAFYQERVMRQIPIRTPQHKRIAVMLATCPAPKPTPDEWAIAGEGSYIAAPDPGEAPMAVDVPSDDPTPMPGLGHPVMVIIYAFAIIGAAMTGFWLMKAAGNVALAMGWVL